MIPTIIGSALALAGSTISISGALLNNLWLNHHVAMRLWMVSNILLLVWALGFFLGYWNGGLSGVSLIAMYAVFAITNAYGLMRYTHV